MANSPHYRPEIDGLRSIAVLGVVLYHYGASWLPGGFTGVDIFFVISGFLITGILRREIAAGHFSLTAFYDRRLRRILPALLVMLATTLCIGWFALMPGAYADLGGSAALAALGFGNVFFFFNTGYFDQSSDLQPLLHTWSLGVEEQFYLVWPLLLLAGSRWLKSARAFFFVFGLLLLASLAYAVWAVGADPKAAFYLPLSRAWELGIGALVAFLPAIRQKQVGEAMNLAGLGLIAWSLLMIHSGMPFPGLNALFACVGTALLVWQKPDTLTGRLLSLRPAVGIGLISYSLYLWHWPVLVLYRHYANSAFPATAELLALLVLSFVLAYLSWRFVERPFRKPLGTPGKTVLAGIGAMAVALAPAAVIFYSGGSPHRVPEIARDMTSLEVMWEWDCQWQFFEPLDGDYCVFGAPLDEARSLGVVFGDSHAEHIAPILEPVARQEGMAFAILPNCPIALGGSVHRVWKEVPGFVDQCRSYRHKVLAATRDPALSTLVFAASWHPLAHTVSSDTFTGDPKMIVTAGINEFIETLDRPDMRLVLVDQMPGFTISPPDCILASLSGLVRKPCSGLAENGHRASIEREGVSFPGFEDLASEFSNLAHIRPRAHMCADGRCLTELDGIPLYRDGNHLRRNLPEATRAHLARLIRLENAIVRPLSTR